ncbi:MAG: peptidoglycan bridge formation protein FemAB [Proteobacteria bacterium]|nr:MAG: peptidoglycan bridge formation protein FemAB [Pseudomonadota bacterium]
MTKLVTRYVTESDFAGWDAFVASHPESTFFHRIGWLRVIRRAFRHEPHYLVTENQEGEMVAVLPLFEVKSALFGHSLVSVPFCVYGGPLAGNEEAMLHITDYAAGLAKRLNVDFLELRNIDKIRDDWPVKSIHSTFIRPIECDDAKNLAAVKYKQRAVVRKSLKNNLEISFPSDSDEFYLAYSTSVRNLGTPVFSKRYFLELKREFGDDCEILSVKKNGQLHSALMSFYFKDTVLPYYGGGLPESRGSKAMDLMYFDQMCRAGKKGYKLYDFGRSKNDSGPFKYKKHWGFEAKPLNYQYFLVNSTELPDLNPLNPKYQLMINTWKKLPLRLSQLIGPLVSKYLG